jgi:hypothetical protein
MRENRLSGSVEGVVSNHDPYSDRRFAYSRRRLAFSFLLMRLCLSALYCFRHSPEQSTEQNLLWE